MGRVVKKVENVNRQNFRKGQVLVGIDPGPSGGFVSKLLYGNSQCSSSASREHDFQAICGQASCIFPFRRESCLPLLTSVPGESDRSANG